MTNGSQSQKNKPNKRKNLGARGERLARELCERQGFSILGQNWSCRYGELDLIIQKGDEIRFVEVKTRRSTAYGYPEESVTKAKLDHLQKAVEMWLELQQKQPSFWQLDVIAIFIQDPEPPQLEWLEGVA